MIGVGKVFSFSFSSTPTLLLFSDVTLLRCLLNGFHQSHCITHHPRCISIRAGLSEVYPSPCPSPNPGSKRPSLVIKPLFLKPDALVIDSSRTVSLPLLNSSFGLVTPCFRDPQTTKRNNGVVGWSANPCLVR